MSSLAIYTSKSKDNPLPKENMTSTKKARGRRGMEEANGKERAREKKDKEEADGKERVREKKDTDGWMELAWIAGLATCLKLLLLPSYHSTDFEVHRHWLAITHTLPLHQWYVDHTTQWTLDYPPFFAWFEWILSHVAAAIDPRIVDLTGGLNYESDACLLFQRVTVILADGLLCFALWSYCSNLCLQKQRLVYVAVLLSPGLFIVDHIHFQYNGFLLGLLLLSLAALREGRDVLGATLFAVLVCFKHLFAIAGPVYLVYLLRHSRGPGMLKRWLLIGISVAAVLSLAFGPFIYYNQILQLFKRLFPFGRGLCHAYWAPNIWALYNTADKLLGLVIRQFGFKVNMQKAGLTAGLVGDLTPYQVLPQISPLISMMLVLFSMAPCLLEVWKHPCQKRIVRCITYAYACGFMFGWHVHEKASLHFVIPFSLFAVETIRDASNYIFLSIVSYYSLFPLLFNAPEYPIKVILLLLHVSVLYIGFTNHFQDPVSVKLHNSREKMRSKMNSEQDWGLYDNIQVSGNRTGKGLIEHELGLYRLVYLFGFIGVEVCAQILQYSELYLRFPFLPLMLRSIYCAFGMIIGFGSLLSTRLVW